MVGRAAQRHVQRLPRRPTRPAPCVVRDLPRLGARVPGVRRQSAAGAAPGVHLHRHRRAKRHRGVPRLRRHRKAADQHLPVSLRYIAAASALAAIAFTLPAAFDGTPRAGDAKAPAASPAGSHRHPPRFEISISYTANLIHWIDNLAGSSQGKTVRAYRQYWQSRFGTPDPGEMELLRSWVILRNKTVTKPEPAILNDRGCLPQREEIPTFRQSFLIRSYEAPGVEEFVASMKDDLSAEEIATLRRTLEKFRPRFDDAWKEASYLPQFEKKLESFLEEGALTAYLGEVASFFGVDPDAFPPSRIELMALPGEGATHAQADGRYLLIEIRPNDTPVEQIQ